MTLPRIPDWWEFLLLTLAAYRVWRILGADMLTRPWRNRLTRRSEETGQTHRGYRPYLDELLHCPWCLGFWICILFAIGWWVSAGWTLWASIFLALSTAVGLLARLDP